MEFVTFLLALVVIGLWVRSSNLKRRIRDLESTVRNYAPFLDGIGDLERQVRALGQPSAVAEQPPQRVAPPPPPPPPPAWEPVPTVPPLVMTEIPPVAPQPAPVAAPPPPPPMPEP